MGFCFLPNRPNAGQQVRGVTTEAVPATPRKGRRLGAVLSWPLAGPGRSGSGSSLRFIWGPSPMAIWVIREGKRGEQEQAALDNNLVTIHWNELPDLSGIKE